MLQHLEVKETAASNALGRHAQEQEYSGRFYGWMKCNRAGCDETAVVIGDARYSPDVDEDGNTDWDLVYRPVAINPPPPMFIPPKACPKEIKTELVRAFGLYWTDPTAAGNVLRGCVELILTAKKVRRTETAGGKRRRLTLHRRIELFQKSDAEAGKALMAVKWIGNEGSHAGALKLPDVLDAVDVIENVIDEFWGDQGGLAQIISEVNRRRRPRSKAKRGK
jgi:hypothetical protein